MKENRGILWLRVRESSPEEFEVAQPGVAVFGSAFARSQAQKYRSGGFEWEQGRVTNTDPPEDGMQTPCFLHGEMFQEACRASLHQPSLKSVCSENNPKQPLGVPAYP